MSLGSRHPGTLLRALSTSSPVPFWSSSPPSLVRARGDVSVYMHARTRAPMYACVRNRRCIEDGLDLRPTSSVWLVDQPSRVGDKTQVVLVEPAVDVQSSPNPNSHVRQPEVSVHKASAGHLARSCVGVYVGAYAGAYVGVRVGTQEQDACAASSPTVHARPRVVHEHVHVNM